MKYKKLKYEDRLPMGMWIDLDGQFECLFNSGMEPIAVRSFEMPWVVEMTPISKSATIGEYAYLGYFYGGPLEMLPRGGKPVSIGQEVLGHFCLGYDVRKFLIDGSNKSYEPYYQKPPKTGANYVPLTAKSPSKTSQKMEQIEKSVLGEQFVLRALTWKMEDGGPRGMNGGGA